ncbi:MAG TPA: substrate-binding domain-containing protein [Candidatus Tumulicola sp.]|jgi:ribose transport system substrate-binding protein
MNLRAAATLALLASLVACAHGGSSSSSGSSSAPNSESSPASGGSASGKTIGVSIQNREAQFYQDMEAGMRDEASKLGYSLTVVDANRDNAQQQSQVEDFVSKKVDAIVLTPYDSQAIGSAIVEANNANIPVFTADIANASSQGKVVAHIASDNVQGGYEAGTLMCKATGGKGDVGIIDEPEVTSVQDRVKGFKNALAKLCPGVKIVADVDSGGARTKANSDAGDILQAHKDLAGIFGINDDSALGAVTAVGAAGMTGKVAIVGYDAGPEARAAIAKGTMYGDALQYPKQIGAGTIDAIAEYFKGTTPSPLVHIPVGTYTRDGAAAH